MARAVSVTADAVVFNALGRGPVRLLGWSILETGGSNAGSFQIKEGGASGTVIAGAGIAASGSSTAWFGPNGVLCNGDIYFDLLGTGTVVGSVFVG